MRVRSDAESRRSRFVLLLVACAAAILWSPAPAGAGGSALLAPSSALLAPSSALLAPTSAHLAGAGAVLAAATEPVLGAAAQPASAPGFVRAGDRSSELTAPAGPRHPGAQRPTGAALPVTAAAALALFVGAAGAGRRKVAAGTPTGRPTSRAPPLLAN